MSRILIDSYPISNWTAAQVDGLGAAFISAMFQSFPSNGGTLHSLDTYLYGIGTITGNAVAKLYAHSGTYGTSSVPTGSPLATSDNVDVATLPSYGIMTPVTFLFTGANKILMPDQYCCWVVEYSGGDGSNAIGAYIDNDAPTHGGNKGGYGGGVWYAESGADRMFEIYKDDNNTLAGISSLMGVSNLIM